MMLQKVCCWCPEFLKRSDALSISAIYQLPKAQHQWAAAAAAAAAAERGSVFPSKF
jgi:hypothetical protein